MECVINGEKTIKSQIKAHTFTEDYKISLASLLK